MHADQKSQQEAAACLIQWTARRATRFLMRSAEFAYVMGQLRERCCETLETVLAKDEDCTMVRHEAAEALGLSIHSKLCLAVK
jgi:hypothetical protein